MDAQQIVSHEMKLRAYCLLLTKDREAAKDLAQATFLRAIRSLHTYQEQGKPVAWLRKIALGLFIDYQRRNAKNRLVSLTWKEGAPSHNEGFANLLGGQLQSAMRQLPEHERKCLELRIAGFRYDEIVAKTGMEMNSVKPAIWRARQRLLAFLREESVQKKPIPKKSRERQQIRA